MRNGSGKGQRQVSQWEKVTAAAQLQRATTLAVEWMVGRWCNCDGNCHEQRWQQWEAVMGDSNCSGPTTMGVYGGGEMDGRKAERLLCVASQL